MTWKFKSLIVFNSRDIRMRKLGSSGRCHTNTSARPTVRNGSKWSTQPEDLEPLASRQPTYCCGWRRRMPTRKKPMLSRSPNHATRHVISPPRSSLTSFDGFIFAYLSNFLRRFYIRELYYVPVINQANHRLIKRNGKHLANIDCGT